jgi:acyl-CoA hydrolase/GNAT superfamily N-acetyltransferase
MAPPFLAAGVGSTRRTPNVASREATSIVAGTSNWKERFAAKRVTLAEAIRLVPKGKHVFIGSGAAEPVGLVEEMVRQYARFADNPILHLLTLGPAPYVDPLYVDRFRHNAIFIGANVRQAIHEGRADYTPVFLSQVPGLMRSRRLPVDVALIQVTPPDAFGFVNLGVSVDIVLAAVEAAKLVVAEVNDAMPVVRGAGYLPVDRIDAWVERRAEVPVLVREPLDEAAREIGRHVATLVADRSTIQVGIGQIPDAVIAALLDKKDLGVWTEMMPDGLVDLIENGNVTGKYKTVEPRKVSASFAFGTKRLYEFMHHNPMLSFQPTDYINDPQNIAKQFLMVAVNSALQIDLTGQVCSDSIGTQFYSGIGGQVDFIRGASMCPGGKPIIAVRSTAKNGTISRIVATLDEGAGVVTSRGDVHYVVTEYGIADLHGRNIRERANALLAVAHPDFRAELLAAAKNRHYIFPDQRAPRAMYAWQYEKPVTARNGTQLLMRPIRDTDEQKLSDFFYNLSESTVYKRWMVVKPRMPHSDLVRYLNVDDRDNVAIVVETQPNGAEPELIGVARYHNDRATNFAEVAFVIRDDWQRQGLGSALLRHLIDIAKQNGVSGFTAEVLESNNPMLHVFRGSGLPVQTLHDGATCRVTLPFE